MTPWVEATLAKYGWIAIGLTFGLAAKYALLIKRGVQIRGYLLAADLLLLPMVALIAFSLVNKAGVHGEAAALVAAAAAVGADRIVKLYTDRFERSVTDIISVESTRRKQVVREEVQMEMSGNRVMEDIAAGKRSLGGEVER